MTELEALKSEIEGLKRRQDVTDEMLRRLTITYRHTGGDIICHRNETETAYLKMLARTGGHEAIKEYQRNKRKRF